MEPTKQEAEAGMGAEVGPAMKVAATDHIGRLVKHRRAQLGKALGKNNEKPVSQGDDKIWGLALSGGGIRSATFCLGLLRALALRKVLLRFDLLSTVSGGGYIGAMLGCLFSRAKTPIDVIQVQDQLGDSQIRWFLWWLRANGRYLIPRGAKDMSFAAAVNLRNLLGIHFELGLLALALGFVLVMVDLIAWWAAEQLGFHQGHLFFELNAAEFLSPWLPSAWFVLVVPMMWGTVQIAAFWNIEWLSRTSSKLTVGLWVGGLLFGLLYTLIPLGYFAMGMADFGNGLRVFLWVSVLALTVIWLLGVPVAALMYSPRQPPNGEPPKDFARNRLTRALSTTFRVAMGIVIAGIVDRAAWFLAFELQDFIKSGLTLLIAAAVLRSLLSVAANMTSGQTGLRALLVAGRILGYVVTFLLCVWWVSLVHKSVLGGLFQLQGLNFGYAWATVLLLAIPIVGYLTLTGYNVSFLNLSSLHGFYRARLSRSYLGAANFNRFYQIPPDLNPGQLGALNEVPPGKSTDIAKQAVGDVAKDDDTTMKNYRPHRYGGPLHLINVCLNQSTDPRGGQFNRDRRGQLLTVVSGGLHRVSLGPWKQLKSPNDLTLASWTAISGAAVSPGLGSMTRGGISALATFAGVRLGYWWEVAARGRKTKPWSFSLAKSKRILRETFGAFEAGPKDDWFLSDGGHFENTGAYALLAQRAQVIVVVDCGTDPEYKFEDLENLVRKARIDLRAEVLFQRPLKNTKILSKAPPKPDELNMFGSINDLASPNETACLALATVTYPDRPEDKGILVVVKPNICHGLPVDLINFKAMHPDFPQQTTVDQFFSEAQWESYHQLGLFLGGKLNEQLLESLLIQSPLWFENDDCSPFERGKAVADNAAAQAPANNKSAARLPARIAATTAVGATLSLGAVTTVGVALWQGIDSARTSFSREVKAEHDALKDLVDKWAKVVPGALPDVKVKAVSELAASLLHTADTLCPTNDAEWFQKSALARTIYDSAIVDCISLLSQFQSDKCARLVETSNPRLEPLIPRCLVPSGLITQRAPPPQYWGYGYTADAKWIVRHPCDPILPEDRGYKCTGQWRDFVPVTKAPAGQNTSADECKGKTVYIQIFGPEQRDAVRSQFREAWRALGASVPPIEDVRASARSAGRAAPVPVSVTTVRMHDPGSAACVEAMKTSLKNQSLTSSWKVEPLAPNLKAIPGTIEVWVPNLALSAIPPASQKQPPTPDLK